MIEKNQMTRLLLIESDPVDVSRIKGYLSESADQCFDVETAVTLEAGLECVARGGMDIVLLDVNLPDSRGLETLVTLKYKLLTEPFIVMTRQKENGLAEQSLAAGAQDYLIKERIDAAVLLRSMRYSIERKRAEETLRKSEQRFRMLFESSQDAIMTLAPPSWRFTSGNPATIAIFQAGDEKTFINTAPWQLSPEFQPDGQRSDEKAKEMINTAMRKGCHFFEWRHKRLGGDEFPATVLLTRCILGNNIFLQATVRDITENKQVENDLKKANRQLENALEQIRQTQEQLVQQERISALGQMAGGIAHDFNNVLMPIVGFSELILSEPAVLDNRNEAIELVTGIKNAAEQARGIVRRLNDFYQGREKIEVEPVDIAGIVVQVVKLTEPKWKTEAEGAGRKIEIRTVLESVPLIEAEKSALKDMFTNLIFNAVDAMPAGGTITIRCRSFEESVEVVFSDTGEGMTEEVKKRCLDPFFSTKGGKGSGQGFAIVNSIIKRHMGTMDLASEYGKGTVFIIRLPVHPTNAIKNENKETVAPVNVPNMRILVVDDDELVLKILARQLLKEGHTVVTANSGTDFMEKVKAAAFDLFILDRALGDMSGNQLAFEMKKHYPAVPVIQLTGFELERSRSVDCPPGVDAVLGKPVTRRVLQQAILKVIRKKGV